MNVRQLFNLNLFMTSRHLWLRLGEDGEGTRAFMYHPGILLVKLRKTMENLSQDGRPRESVTLAPGSRELGEITYISSI